MKKINPNYVAYAASRGMTPEECMESDEKQWTGGKMCGFILFISEQTDLFDKEHGRVPGEFFYRDAEKFSQWLQNKFLVTA